MFDFSQIDDFDNHISLSIPNYEFLLKQVISFIESLAQNNTSIVDIGCSTGRLLSSTGRRKAKYYGIDNSDLIDKAQDDGVNLIKEDFLSCDMPSDCSVITSIFFLQFLSYKERALALKKIKKSIIKGGCFIVAEKTYSNSPLLEHLLTIYHNEEKRASFKPDEIMDKAVLLTMSMSLRTENQFYNELKLIGQPYVFWKSYGFTAYLVIK